MLMGGLSVCVFAPMLHYLWAIRHNYQYHYCDFLGDRY
jgi:hypothetical protein